MPCQPDACIVTSIFDAYIIITLPPTPPLARALITYVTLFTLAVLDALAIQWAVGAQSAEICNIRQFGRSSGIPRIISLLQHTVARARTCQFCPVIKSASRAVLPSLLPPHGALH